MCTKISTLSSNGRGWANGYFGEEWCLGWCHLYGCLCMVAHVLAWQVWLSICLMVSGRKESSMCQLHFSSGWLPHYTWDGLTLNLFCSFTFIVNITHKQQHQFTFQQILVMGNSSNIPNSTWYMYVQGPSATTNGTINTNNHTYV